MLYLWFAIYLDDHSQDESAGPLFNRWIPDGKAEAIGHYETALGDFRKVTTIAERLASVTAEDVARCVRHYLKPEGRTIVIAQPESDDDGDSGDTEPLQPRVPGLPDGLLNDLSLGLLEVLGVVRIGQGVSPPPWWCCSWWCSGSHPRRSDFSSTATLQRSAPTGRCNTRSRKSSGTWS